MGGEIVSLLCIFLGITTLMMRRIIDPSAFKTNEIVSNVEQRLRMLIAGTCTVIAGIVIFFLHRSMHISRSSANLSTDISFLGWSVDLTLFVAVGSILFIVAGVLLTIARNDIAEVLTKGPEIITESTTAEKAHMVHVASRIFLAAGITSLFWVVFQIL